MANFFDVESCPMFTWANCCESCFASSIAWFWILIPPKSSTSVPTSPLADDESPYEIFQVEPSSRLKVLDLVGSKATCWFWVFA